MIEPRERYVTYAELLWLCAQFTPRALALAHWVCSAVGMVWEAVDAVQKLPESNKAAYRRYVMKVKSCLVSCPYISL
jgi:hypothetical protein